MSEILLASRNAKKLGEMQRILADALPDVRVLGLDDVPEYAEPVEDRPDFVGNALLKARVAYAETGLAAVADDSGLCVDALHGMPGVISARWSGRPRDDDRNNALLLDQLHDVPDEQRGAEFRCAVAVVAGEGAEHAVEGVMRGRIIREQRGTRGFGYDVLFVPEEQTGALTSAEMDAATKDAISHRGRALREIAPTIADVIRNGRHSDDDV